MYYCFNVNCNRWGESVYHNRPDGPVQRGILLIGPPDVIQGTSGTCPGCGGVGVYHDNWKGAREA